MNRADFPWDEFAWTTRVPLPPDTWAATAGTLVPLYYAPEGREEHPPDDAEIASAAWTVDRLPALLAAARPALSAHAVHTLEPEDLATASDLIDAVRVSALHVHSVSRDGIPYVGIALSCPWDEEHGLGILMHGPRVVDAGGADTALLRRIAERDATDPRAGLDESLIGHWDSAPFDHGVMESSEVELRANGEGWSSLANLGGEYVTRLTWSCPEPGVLQLRDEDGRVTRHRYVVGPAVPPYGTEPVTSVTFEEAVQYGHQFAKSGYPTEVGSN
ncbi:hypothetical protein [Streptomyces sp. NBC_01373]|uniref:DUF6985 domain-containing protein n=1 Tax=Streptomyces sp. NBC_01373 TaxID=2903843 RepID=UPI002252BEBF|nr:hypothetical protein [Streptomyces sp. NBC_01373]MCX4697274.1 hypothetical protein [Streptomyces sp. NBC_01373]